MFAKFLPDIQRVSLYELLAGAEGLKSVHVYDNASVFDPCNARKNPQMEMAVRELSSRSGARLYELPEKNRCCGYGGHMSVANPELYGRITENRAGMGENPYIVYCVNCLEVFRSRGKDSVHILDIAFDIPRAERTPRIHEKRSNAISVKRRLVKEFTGVYNMPEAPEWNKLELIISDELFDDMEKKLISLMDVKETIYYGETTGDVFFDESSGIFRCSLEKPVLTYWVSYRKAGSAVFEVLEAYSHRMHFSKEDA
jgi:hypothetical protein